MVPARRGLSSRAVVAPMRDSNSCADGHCKNWGLTSPKMSSSSSSSSKLPKACGPQPSWSAKAERTAPP